jgi:hypothetical protein
MTKFSKKSVVFIKKKKKRQDSLFLIKKLIN